MRRSVKRRYTHSLIRGPSRARKWPLLCSRTPPDLLTTMRIISPNNMAGSTVLPDVVDVPGWHFTTCVCRNVSWLKCQTCPHLRRRCWRTRICPIEVVKMMDQRPREN